MTFYNLLEGFDVPEWKRHLNKKNVEWLVKNLGKRNSNHPRYESVMKSLEKIKEEKSYKC